MDKKAVNSTHGIKVKRKEKTFAGAVHKADQEWGEGNPAPRKARTKAMFHLHTHPPSVDDPTPQAVPHKKYQKKLTCKKRDCCHRWSLCHSSPH